MDWGEVIVALAGILIPILVIGGAFGVVVFVVWLKTRQRKAELEMRAQIYNRLLEKYGSAQELAEFLKTEEGRTFLRGLAMPPAQRPATVLRWIRTGLILTFLGLAFILWGWWPTSGDPDLMFVGFLLTALGIAFLLGAGVTHWLGRRLDESETESGRTPSR